MIHSAKPAARSPAPTIPGTPIDYRCARGLLRRVIAVLGGLRIEGFENLPASGRLIIAANHVSVLDPPMMGLAVGGLRFPSYLAKQELFQVPVFSTFIARWGAIPLARKRGDMGAIRSAIGILEKEGCIVMFPEGSRKRPGVARRPKPGVGLLARETGASVIPTRLFNTEHLFGPKPFRVRFGAPIRFGGGDDRGDCQRFADEVMERIWSL